MEDWIDYENRGFPQDKIRIFSQEIVELILPKFDSLVMDKINGLGITIHDVHATRIDITSLEVISTGWRAKIKYVGQDHFGLDLNDMRNHKFNQFQFFRIWFILQRFNRFGFRPFLTNMEATIDIEGIRQ